MKKHFSNFFLLTIAIALIPTTVNATTNKKVNTQADFKDALNNKSITTITLNSDIETTEKINITRDITIDGNNKALKYIGTFGSSNSNDNTIWSSIYVLQAYKSNVTLKNIKLTNGNAGLLVNGGHVTIVGKINVSGNGFGGIELGKGKGVNTSPTLTLTTNAKIINTTEVINKPTLWVPNDTKDAIIEIKNTKFPIQKGQELTIEKIDKLEEALENPETNDSLIINIFFLTIFIILSSYSFNEILNKK